jgi:hypothetical protein
MHRREERSNRSIAHDICQVRRLEGGVAWGVPTESAFAVMVLMSRISPAALGL